MIQHNVLAGRGLWVFGALSSDSPNGLVAAVKASAYFMARSIPIQACGAFAAHSRSSEARASVRRLGLVSMSWSQLSWCPILLIFAEPSPMADDGSSAICPSARWRGSARR